MELVLVWTLAGLLAVACGVSFMLHARSLSRARTERVPTPSHTESLFAALRSEVEMRQNELRGEINLLRQEWQSTLDQLISDREALNKQYRKVMAERRREERSDEPEPPHDEPQGRPPSVQDLRKALQRRRA